MSSRLPEIDPTFKQDLRESKHAVHAVAEYLRKHDCEVTEDEIRVAPRIEDWREYTDDGDLTAKHAKHGTLEIEVKGRDLHFDDRDPFPFSTVFVDNKRRFDAKPEAPFAYYVVNRQLTHALRTHVATTRHAWTIRHTIPRKRLEPVGYDVYEIPLRLTVLVTL